MKNLTNKIQNESQAQTPEFTEDLELSLEDLDSLVGGMLSSNALYKGASLSCGTGGTRSVCHIDGTDDADSAF
jgi:hypothetical protein